MLVVQDVVLEYKLLGCLADLVLVVLDRVVAVVERGEVTTNCHKVTICSLSAILIVDVHDVGDIICIV